MSMRIFLLGGTGLIGQQLVGELIGRGDTPVVLSRRGAQAAPSHPGWASVQWVQGDPKQPGAWMQVLDGCDAVVNLVGENLFAKRWTPEIKREIASSRIEPTRNLVEAIRAADHRPSVLVQGSAVGYYGSTGERDLSDLQDHPPGDDFLAEVCRDWERAADPAAEFDIRITWLRTGIVLSRQGGALKVMEPIFKWVPGGAAPIGSRGWLAPALGRQWFPWIHIADQIGLILLALDHPQAHGPLNATAPRPVRNAEFSRELAKVLRRPFLPIGPPDAILRAVLGEVSAAVTSGQRALPDRAVELDYTFRYPRVDGALAALYAE